MNRYRWAWFFLASFAVFSLVWSQRYEYAACDVDGCIAINRWTGAVYFRTALDAEGPSTPGSSVVLNRRTSSEPRAELVSRTRAGQRGGR